MWGENVYLVPRGLGTVPTPHNLRLLERFKIRVKQALEARIADLKALSEQIAKMPFVTVEANANEEGHLYGSVAARENIYNYNGLSAHGVMQSWGLGDALAEKLTRGAWPAELNLDEENIFLFSKKLMCESTLCEYLRVN